MSHLAKITMHFPKPCIEKSDDPVLQSLYDKRKELQKANDTRGLKTVQYEITKRRAALRQIKNRNSTSYLYT